MSNLVLTTRTVDYKLYGLLMRHCGGSREVAGRLMYLVDTKCPVDAPVWAWVKAGLKSRWLFDNQPGQKEYEAWAAKVWGKKGKKQPKRAGEALPDILRAMADKMEAGR